MCGFLLYLLVWTLFNFVQAEIEIGNDPLDNFVDDIIMTWKLRSPTIIFREESSELANLCRRRDMMLCVTNYANVTEIGEHLAKIHEVRKQDSLFFVGSNVHERLLREIIHLMPSILTNNCPVFMPKEFSDMVKLRLDSNIIFYEVGKPSEYKLLDIFAVKDGPKITIELGKWDSVDGMRLKRTMNRWERRTDLKGAPFVNGVASNNWAGIIKDEEGNIVGSQGFFPDMLFYITDQLNLTIETLEVPYSRKLLKNGSWSGAFGLFQQKKIDVESTGVGIKLERTSVVDYPLPMLKNPRALVAQIPFSTAPNMWVYVRVFGVAHWSFILGTLTLCLLGLTTVNIFNNEDSKKAFGTKRGVHPQYQLDSLVSGVGLVFLYALQMGSHITTKHVATRSLTLTMSMLTLLVFTYYTTDITAEMTSGPGNIPLRNFEDVLYHGYSVIVCSSFYREALASAEPNSAKYIVYKTYIEPENISTIDMALKKVATDEKVVLYYGLSVLASKDAENYTNKLVGLKLNEYSLATFPLQKNSEFLQLFNYYILKEYEHGIIKNIYRKHHAVFFTNEQFQMMEPQGLSTKNVMFTFIFLGLAVCVSLLIAFAEFSIGKKQLLKKTSQTAWAATRSKAERIPEKKTIPVLSPPPSTTPGITGHPDVESRRYQEIKVKDILP